MKTMKKNGQAGFQGVVISIVIVAVLLLIAVLVFSKVGKTGTNLFDVIAGTNYNETITAGALNTYISLTDGDNDNCVVSTVWNATGAAPNLAQLNNWTANGCTLNVTNDDVVAYDSVGDTVNVKVSYSYENFTDLAARESYDNIRTTTLDAFDLVVIGLIVLAAVAILTVLFMLGVRKQSG